MEMMWTTFKIKSDSATWAHLLKLTNENCKNKSKTFHETGVCQLLPTPIPKIKPLKGVHILIILRIISNKCFLSPQMITNEINTPISVMQFCVLLTLLCVVWMMCVCECVCTCVFSLGWFWLPLVQDGYYNKLKPTIANIILRKKNKPGKLPWWCSG